VRTWGNQLRLINFDDLAASPTDLLVIDHGLSDDFKFIRKFEPGEIARLKTKPDGTRRLVISYISIGEAERYRYYFDQAWFEPGKRPSWLGPENPRWAGNYPVDYWQPEWQRIITGGPDSYIARIAAQGFDGVYLDRSDVYEELLARHPQGAKTMAAFIARLAAELRTSNPQALVILQNAEELTSERSALDAIDAVAKEDLYYGIDHTEAANPAATTAFAEKTLMRARAAGKRIFLIEYVKQQPLRDHVVARSRANGFLPYFAPRDMSSISLSDIVQPVSP
jgi:cysteinyl-tRNA synthetase